MSSTGTEPTWASSKDEWKQRSFHNITLPSGLRATIRFPDLEGLIRNDALPERLLGIALRDILGVDDAEAEGLAKQVRDGDTSKARELANELTDLQRFLTLEALVEPKVTIEEVESGEFDARDFEMLRQIAMRERNTDAKGVFLGVVPLDLFTTFRDVHERIGGADWGKDHPAGLVEGCPACETFDRGLSAVRGL